MSELSFEQMLEDSVKTIRNGEIVQGTVCLLYTSLPLHFPESQMRDFSLKQRKITEKMLLQASFV